MGLLKLLALGPGLPLHCQGQILFYWRNGQEAWHPHLMGMETKDKNSSSHPSVCLLSWSGQLGIHDGGGSGEVSSHSSQRKLCK